MGIHIGTSGWSYDHWQGVLYPHGTPVHDRLGYYMQRFQTAGQNHQRLLAGDGGCPMGFN
jgi:uncharacterized protein YecE (DUF72 family)